MHALRWEIIKYYKLDWKLKFYSVKESQIEQNIERSKPENIRFGITWLICSQYLKGIIILTCCWLNNVKEGWFRRTFYFCWLGQIRFLFNSSFELHIIKMSKLTDNCFYFKFLCVGGTNKSLNFLSIGIYTLERE